MKAKNLVVVMSDEHSPKFMGVSGHPIIQTPNMDRLANGGLRFSRCYTPCPICVPARAAFATGKHVHEIRHWDNAMPYTGAHRGWGHVLQDNGIQVESIGKLHYRNNEDPAGFDVEHIPMHVAGGHGMVWASIRDPIVTPDERGNARMLGSYIGPGESPYTEYDRSVTDYALRWIQNYARTTTNATDNSQAPFVLYIGLVAPHFPLVCPEPFYQLYPHNQLPEPKLSPASGYQRHPWIETQNAMMDSESTFKTPQERITAIAAYHGLVSWLDHNLGLIMQALEDSGLSQNTNLIYTSDHGDNVGARGLWGKSNMYEECVAVPMIINGPDITPAVCHTPVDLLDLYPTILETAGLQYASYQSTRKSQSLYKIASEPDNQDRTIFSQYHAAGSNTAAFMVCNGHWKLIYYIGHQPELFDLTSDPEELQNLATEQKHQDVLAKLTAQLHEWCDPKETDAQAKRDQAALIEKHGGRQKALRVGAPGATPPPKT